MGHNEHENDILFIVSPYEVPQDPPKIQKEVNNRFSSDYFHILYGRNSISPGKPCEMHILYIGTVYVSTVMRSSFADTGFNLLTYGPTGPQK